MKILLLGINARYTHSNLALRYLRQILKAEGLNPILQEYYISQPPVEILEGVGLVRPDVVLVSAYIWNSRLLQDLLPDLRSLLPRAQFILGGPEASWQTDFWFSVCPTLDLIIKGPGEGAVKALAQDGFDLQGITAPGLPRVFSRPPLALEEIPFPYESGEESSLAGRYIYFESSRGCPFSCSYCLSGRKDAALEFRSLEKTLEELRFLTSWAPHWHNSLLIKFVDRTFNAKKDRARNLWQELSRWDTKARFHFEVHPALLDPQDLEVLAQVPPGRFQFEIGVQSTTPKTLSEVGRLTGWTEMKPMIRQLIALGNIPVHLDLIAGLPGEGLGEVAAALDELYDLGPEHIQLGFLKNLPGSPLAEKDYGFICQHRAPYQVLETPDLSREDFAQLRRWEELVEGIYNNPKVPGLMDRAVARHGGFSRSLKALSQKARDLGFDLTTRNPEKLLVFVES